ncbi:MAG: DUF1684 domain-containing protein [Candidatus Limnocylindrales bacterium]
MIDPLGRGATLEIADWRRRVATLYADVRATAATDPRAAWETWSAVREELYRTHPQSPVPAGSRAAFKARHWPYDPSFRFEVRVEALEDETLLVAPLSPGATTGLGSIALPMSTGSPLEFARFGRVTIPFTAGTRSLELFWMAGYAGGLFLPFRDATNGTSTYGAGRYLLDAAKGADLGGDAVAETLVLDFNFAFQPSCAFDPRWACPLAPPSNRLDLPIEAGERIA